MINLEQLQRELDELPEEAQALLMDFVELLKKRYGINEKQKMKSETKLDDQLSTLDILKDSGLIGCISAEPDLSTNYKSVLKKGLDSKYDNR
ncbi:DUF2281 domain-containing protein [Crocosphaera sp. XPORK-15E]|uniref:DUF2281 domain-containing protein n=1 Tax=Crocosphaera sp. XPORK-15E TaxID=3110247 RepID=UPI002B1FB560|nr:DUF2281 domain-containing protein [Crocosphaera sp. XPORK-15E]MEA5537076.1 DUF2281 domain-containing protein [Crocosphaera sp. XPORK-15E]